MYKSKTVTKEFANGTSTVAEEQPDSFDVLRTNDFHSISVSEFADLADKKTVDYLELNYPEYALGSILAEEDNSSFIIKYNPGEGEELQIHITQYTLYFDKTTKLYKSNNYTIIYTLTESWRVSVDYGNFTYEPTDYLFSGNGVTLLAQFDRGFLSASLLYPEIDEKTEVRRNVSRENSKVKYEQETTYYGDNDEDHPISEIIEYAAKDTFKEDDVVKRTTVYSYNE